MSVIHDVGLSSVQWRASNRQGRPSSAAHARLAGRVLYATVGKRAARRRYEPLRREDPGLVRHFNWLSVCACQL